MHVADVVRHLPMVAKVGFSVAFEFLRTRLPVDSSTTKHWKFLLCEKIHSRDQTCPSVSDYSHVEHVARASSSFKLWKIRNVQPQIASFSGHAAVGRLGDRVRLLRCQGGSLKKGGESLPLLRRHTFSRTVPNARGASSISGVSMPERSSRFSDELCDAGRF